MYIFGYTKRAKILIISVLTIRIIFDCRLIVSEYNLRGVKRKNNEQWNEPIQTIKVWRIISETYRIYEYSTTGWG